MSDQKITCNDGENSDEFTKEMSKKTFRQFNDSNELSKIESRWNNKLSNNGNSAIELLEKVKFDMDAIKKDNDRFSKCLTTDGNEELKSVPIDTLIEKGKKAIIDACADSDLTFGKMGHNISKSKYYQLLSKASNEQFDNVSEQLESGIKTSSLTTENEGKILENLIDSMSGNELGSAITSGSSIAEEFESKTELFNLFESGNQSGLISGVIGGGMKVLPAYWAYSKGERSFGEVATIVTKESAKCYATGYSVSTISEGISETTNLLGQNFLGVAQANAPVAIAAAMVKSGKSLYSFARGKIPPEKLLEDVSLAAITSTAVIYYGALGALVLGSAPLAVGGLIGAGVGMFVGKMLHQSGLIALGKCSKVKIAENRRKQVETICLAAIAEIERSRIEFEKIVNEKFFERKMRIVETFSMMNSALINHDPDTFILGLSEVNNWYGKTLGLSKFREFDDIMTNPNKRLEF